MANHLRAAFVLAGALCAAPVALAQDGASKSTTTSKTESAKAPDAAPPAKARAEAEAAKKKVEGPLPPIVGTPAGTVETMKKDGKEPATPTSSTAGPTATSKLPPSASTTATAEKKER
jgi:hypothetical protein